jgi:hypothetical protein
VRLEPFNNWGTDGGYNSLESGTTNQGVIGALRFATGDKLAAQDDAAFSEGDLLANLHHPVPGRPLDGGADELGTDVALAEVFLVHKFYCPTSGLCSWPWRKQAGFVLRCCIEFVFLSFNHGNPYQMDRPAP